MYAATASASALLKSLNDGMTAAVKARKPGQSSATFEIAGDDEHFAEVSVFAKNQAGGDLVITTTRKDLSDLAVNAAKVNGSRCESEFDAASDDFVHGCHIVRIWNQS